LIGEDLALKTLLLMPNYPNNCVDDTIPTIYLILWNKSNPPISPKMSNGTKSRRYNKTVSFQCPKSQFDGAMKKNIGGHLHVSPTKRARC